MNEDVWPGMGQRIRQRIRDLGYPSVEKFTQAFPKSEYSASLVSKWIREEVAPSRASVLKLAQDLECEPAYLFFGKPVPTGSRRRPVPIAGGSAASLLPAVEPAGVDEKPPTPPMVQKSMKSRLSRDIMSSLHASRARRLHLIAPACTGESWLRAA